MNQYYQNFKSSPSPRQFVFEKALSLLNQRPANILEIGSIRDLSLQAKDGDGYSTLFWCEYVQKYGGSITVVDISQHSIDNCKTVTSDFSNKIDIKYFIQDGYPLINDSFDLIYLDGSDDNNEMIKQFEKCNRQKSLIVCDDANRGGKCDLLRQKYPNYELFDVNWLHQMIMYPKIQ